MLPNIHCKKKYPVKKGRLSGAASNVIIEENKISNTTSRLTSIDKVKLRFNNLELKPVRFGVVGMLYAVKSPIEIVKAVHQLISKELKR